MVDRTLAVIVCACLALAGTLALSAWYRDEPPLRVSLGDAVRLSPGTRVVVEGRLADRSDPTEPGFAILQLEDGSGGSLRAFLAFPEDTLLAGDVVRLTGVISLYDGNVELLVTLPEDLEVLSRGPDPDPGHVPLRDLMEEPWVYEGAEPLVQVEVVTWPMEDLDGGSCWCLVSGVDGGDETLAFAQLDGGTVQQGMEPGALLDLRVAVRYDPSSGFVYLEVLGPA